MKAYVIMSNDFPDSVWEHEADAEAYCAERMAEQTNKTFYPYGPRIYYRVYPFDVQSKRLSAAQAPQTA